MIVTNMTSLLCLGSDVMRLILQFCPLTQIQICRQTCKSIQIDSHHRVVLKHVTIPVISLTQFQMLAQSPIYSNLSRLKASKWSDSKYTHFNRHKGSKCIDPFYLTLEKFQYLNQLDLNNLYLGPSGAHLFGKNLPYLPHLTHLNLANNLIKKAGCESVHKALTLVPHLTHLNLANNRINQTSSFASLPLITLNLSENCINWRLFPDYFWPPSLLHLDISLSGIMQANEWAGTGIAIFSKIPPNLITLKLSGHFYQITEQLVQYSPLPPTLNQLSISDILSQHYPTLDQQKQIKLYRARNQELPALWGQLNKTLQTSVRVEFNR
jgi:hypothetical protein